MHQSQHDSSIDGVFLLNFPNNIMKRYPYQFHFHWDFQQHTHVSTSTECGPAVSPQGPCA